MAAPIEAQARAIMTGEAPLGPPPLESWPELVPLDVPELPTLEAGLLPGWAGDFAQALVAATETPLELPASMVLACAAVAAARRLRVEVSPGHVEPTNLWIVTALPPGNRKSAVLAEASAPLLYWERDQATALEPEIKRVTSDRRTQEARAKAFRARAAKELNAAEAAELAQEAADIEAELPEPPVPPRLWTSDATPERLGALLAEHGECMAWLSSEGGLFDILAGRYSQGIPNLDLVLKAHSGDADRVDRAGRVPVYLRSPRLTVGLSPQPSVLEGLASKEGFRGRGLLARFLYLMPRSPLGFRKLDTRPIPEAVAAAYVAGLRAMLDWPPATDEQGNEVPHLVHLTDQARAEWQQFERAIEDKMKPGEELEHFTDWAGKAPGTAARLAAVLHGIEHAHGRPWETPITGETMHAALTIMAVITKHSAAALGLMGADPTLAAGQALWSWIRRGRRAVFREREAFNGLRGTFPRMAHLREALEVLVERGLVTVIEPERQGPGRPPSPFVYVRPDIAGSWR